MSKTIEQLRAQAAQIEEATRQGENTQIRVGGLFTDVIDFIAQIPITETVLGPLLQALNNSQLIDPSDGQTLTFSIMKDGWTFSDALTQLKISINGIEQTVTSNYEAFLSVKDQLQREVAATDQRVRNYKTDYDNSQIEYATWKSQTDTQISQYAVAIDKNTGDIISISGRVDTAYDQLDFVTNDLEAADRAIGKLFDLTGMELTDDPSASWLYKNRAGIYGAAATFDENGNIKQSSKLQVTINGIETEVSNAEGQVSLISQTVDQISATVSTVDGRVSTLSQTVDEVSARVSTVDGKYSELKVDLNSISAIVNDPTTGIGALNVKADSVESRLTTVEGKTGEMGLYLKKDEFGNTLINGHFNADIFDFHFTDGWAVYYGSSDDNKVMWLDNNGDLHITGTFYGHFPDGVDFGQKTNKKMWIEDSEYNGARLIGKNGNKETILLGFDNKYPTDQYGVLKLGYVEENSYAELHTHYFHIQYGTRWVSLWAETGIEIVNQGTFRIGLYGGDAGSRVRIMADYARWPKRKQDVEIGEVYIDGNNNLKVNDGLG